jgi:hypothetical protein
MDPWTSHLGPSPEGHKGEPLVSSPRAADRPRRALVIVAQIGPSVTAHDPNRPLTKSTGRVSGRIAHWWVLRRTLARGPARSEQPLAAAHEGSRRRMTRNSGRGTPRDAFGSPEGVKNGRSKAKRPPSELRAGQLSARFIANSSE